MPLYGAAQYGGGVIDLLAEDGRDNGGQGGAVLVTRNYRETWTTGTLVGSTVSGLGVERVDTLTLRRQPVERGKSGASEYITDGHGTVRIMALESANDSGMLRGRTVYLYRKAGSREWLPLSTVTDGGGLGAGSAQGFDPYAVDRDLNAAYGFDRHDGRARSTACRSTAA